MTRRVRSLTSRERENPSLAQRKKSCWRALRRMSVSVWRKRTNGSAPRTDWLCPHSFWYPGSMSIDE